MRRTTLLTAVVLSLGSGSLSLACSKQPAPKPLQPEQEAKVVPAEGKGEPTEPRVGPNPKGEPAETAPPNVPEFKPAFPGQTRAPAVHTQTQFRVTEVAGPFDRPWALTFLPDRRMLVTEKHAGKLLLVGQDGRSKLEVQGVPRVDGRDQGGLLDVALSPAFATDKWIYLSYYEPREGGNGLTVLRAKLDLADKPRLHDSQVIFRMLPTLDSSKHAGGRLAFGPGDHLFVMLGERSVKEGRKQARDLNSHFGKIVRILPSGKVPEDNPFVKQAGAKPEIWTLGHRNILAADFDAQQRLWVVEMGPRGGDELNLIERGKDYGWPTIGYGEEYSGASIHEATQAPGLEQPVYYWDPVISPGALTIYDGELFPEWQGNFFIAGLSSQALIRLVVENQRVVGEERLLTDRAARIREVVQGPQGALYLLTDGEEGKLLQLTPSASAKQ